MQKHIDIWLTTTFRVLQCGGTVDSMEKALASIDIFTSQIANIPGKNPADVDDILKIATAMVNATIQTLEEQFQREHDTAMDFEYEETLISLAYDVRNRLM